MCTDLIDGGYFVQFIGAGSNDQGFVQPLHGFQFPAFDEAVKGWPTYGKNPHGLFWREIFFVHLMGTGGLAPVLFNK
jgi:hypothetical protein